MAYNPLFRLKGNLDREPKKPGGGISLGDLKTVDVNHLLNLKKTLSFANDYFMARQEYFSGVLVDAIFNRVISKSKRIHHIFPERKYKNIVGIRFDGDSYEDKHHVITYFLTFDQISNAIKELDSAIAFLDDYGGSFNDSDLKEYLDNFHANNQIKTIIDTSNIASFSVPHFHGEVSDSNVVTFFNVGDMNIILNKLGILKTSPSTILDNNTFVLSKDDLNTCIDKADYLISMSLDEFSYIDIKDDDESEERIHLIPKPNNEPTIGVIDTLFDKRAYFNEWVESHNMVAKEIPTIEDKIHATKVCSIIVDGPSLNPKLDDGCGRFKVRLFEVAVNGRNNSLEILEKIEKIVKENQDIHVWNLSLGSQFEISRNFISPEAFSLDKLQSKYNVIFVVSATNTDVYSSKLSSKRIGSPADSINSLVVGSCNFKKQPASYSRKGGVLSFFIKPDVLYYGGDILDERIVTNNGFKDCLSQGTSFAAPWISRKMCYLMDVLHFDRETAKALIIDSAIGWDPMPTYENTRYSGYGVVPIKIHDIVNSKTDEIRFYFRDTIESYSTGTLMIPVPVNEVNRIPFNVKATLCYFCDCDRNQGVDYTMTEMDLSVGVKKGNTIKTINKNIQSDDNSYVLEGSARVNFRKWDSVKHVSEKLTNKSRMVYDNNKYGFRIFTKERFYNEGTYGYKFALIITLKEQKGLNRSEQFIRECQSTGWLVLPIVIEENVESYYESQNDIILE